MLARGSKSHRPTWRWLPRRVVRRLAAPLVVLALVALATAGSVLAEGITNAGDDLRDGWYPEQSALTPQLVSGGTFGQLWSGTVDGEVYAQPLYVNDNLLVATENNKVYLMDSATGAMRSFWRKKQGIARRFQVSTPASSI